MAAVFALLGCTHPHSRMHLSSLRVSPEVDRVWLWDPDRAAAEALGEAAGAKLAGTTDDLDAALREEVEFALVCRSNEVNPETVAAAALSGKHVLSEKPMATTAAVLRPVLAEVSQAGVALGVCYPWRCHPASRDLRRMVEQGLLGRLIATEARMVTSQVRNRDPGHWLFTRSRGGGGILHWLGCHFLDLLRYLLHDEVTHVSALTGTLGGCDVEVEDTATVSMRWASGALGTFAAGYHLPRSSSGYSGAAYDTSLNARGVLGRFDWQPTRSEEEIRVESVHPEWAGAPERRYHYSLEESEAYGGRYGLEFLHAFIRNARDGQPQVAGGEDALRVLEWLEAVYRSAESGRGVEVGRSK